MIYYMIFLSTVRISTVNTEAKAYKIHFIFICIVYGSQLCFLWWLFDLNFDQLSTYLNKILCTTIVHIKYKFYTHSLTRQGGGTKWKCESEWSWPVLVGSTYPTTFLLPAVWSWLNPQLQRESGVMHPPSRSANDAYPGLSLFLMLMMGNNTTEHNFASGTFRWKDCPVSLSLGMHLLTWAHLLWTVMRGRSVGF